jgi:SAM-dependent methyltransferase
MNANIEALYRPTHDERARQHFVSGLRKHAIIDMRRELKRDYDERVAPALQARGKSARDWRDIESAMQSEPSYRFYSSIRYNSQEMCYLSVQPAIERALPQMIDAAREAAHENRAGGSLRLDPALEIPRYVSALDVHLAPGCFHTEFTRDDVAQGAVVSFGGKVFTGQHPYRKRPGVVAESVGYWLHQTRPDFRPRRILDLGTTSGKNLTPYSRSFPQAELYGVDVGAPVLRFGHALAEQEGVAVHYSQQNAESTDFPDGHFDLIVSSFFFHEVALPATRRILRECWRLLAPNAIMVHMELPNAAAVSHYDNFYWNWDTRNNNEPHYTIFREQDPQQLCVAAGFAPQSCFAQVIPDVASFGQERYADFLRGAAPAPPHGMGGWFVFGASKA